MQDTAPRPIWAQRLADILRRAPEYERQQNALRRQWIAYWRHRNQVLRDAEAANLLPGEYDLPPLPDELRGLTCGAKAKSTGVACMQTHRFPNGRCRFHGGASTGPRSEVGKQSSRENGRLGGRPAKPKPMEEKEAKWI